MFDFFKKKKDAAKVKLPISKEAKDLFKKGDFHRTDVHLWKGELFHGTVSEVLTTQKGEFINETLVQNNLLATKYQNCSHLFVGNSKKLSLREFFDYMTTYPEIKKELDVRKDLENFFKCVIYITNRSGKQYTKEWHVETKENYVNRQLEKLKILEFTKNKM